MYLSTKNAADHYGVCPDTLRRWAATGKVKTTRTPGGNYRYWVPDQNTPTDLITATVTDTDTDTAMAHPSNDSRVDIIYTRVSNAGQRHDLEKQARCLLEAYPRATVVQDIGSGLGFNRRGLQTVLEQICLGQCRRVIVAHRDRISRFSFELFEWICKRHNAEIVVINDDSPDGKAWRPPRDEVVEDMMTVMHTFSNRLYGNRKFSALKFKSDCDAIAEEEDASASASQLRYTCYDGTGPVR